MDKDVIIHVRGLQVIEEGQEEEEPIELVVPGQYFLKNGCHYLRYEERFEDFKGEAINYVKLDPEAGTMEVRKKGLIETTMEFKKGETRLCTYRTPYGIMQMGIRTSALTIREEEKLLEVRADYMLDVEEQHLAECYIQFRAHSKGSPDFTL